MKDCGNPSFGCLLFVEPIVFVFVFVLVLVSCCCCSESFKARFTTARVLFQQREEILALCAIVIALILSIGCTFPSSWLVLVPVVPVLVA